MDAGPAKESDSLPALMTVLHSDLRRLAHLERLRGGRPETLQTTVLIHEAYLKLNRGGDGVWNDRRHFMRIAAITMRQILVDAARARLSEKRGSGVAALPLEEAGHVFAGELPDDLMVRVGDALEHLGALNPRLARVVECRFFAGYSEFETAEALEINCRTVERDWVKARAWLFRELSTA